jgi:hypothetical protein
MACPFFMPTNRFDDGGWIHPARLPLGAGWKGHCCAPGHVGEEPTAEELREWCNLGYASQCGRRPKENAADSVRFAVTRDHGQHITVLYSIETAHLPSGHGTVEYDATQKQWSVPHPAAHVLKMVDCFMQSYLSRKASSNPENTSTTSS